MARGAQTMADTGTFPSLKKILRSDSFTDPTTESNKKTNDYFWRSERQRSPFRRGSAPDREVPVPPPVNPYAQTAYGDEVSKAYSGDITLEGAEKLCQQARRARQSSRATTSPSTQPIYCRYIRH